MQTQTSPPAAPGNSVRWRQLRWSLPFLAALLPIILLSAYSYRISSESVRFQVEAENLSALNNLAQDLTQDFTKMSAIAHAVASVPGSLNAIREKDDIAMRQRLRSLVLAYPQIDRVFVTDERGILWADYPQVPGVFGRSQESAEWFSGISERWKPYISSVYMRPHDGASLVAVATPVFDEDGSVRGALVLEYKTDLIRRSLLNMRVGRAGSLFVLDHKGAVIAHPGVTPEGVLVTDYAQEEHIHAASGGIVTTDYHDPLTDERMLASFQPLSMGSNTWILAAQQPVDVAYALLNRVRVSISLAGAVLTLFTLGMVIALAMTTRRNERLNTELAAKNQTLRDITSFVSHQLRAPVTAMRWTIEEIMDGDTGPVGEETKKTLQELHDVAIQNGKLIDDILNVSRIDRGVIEVQTEPVALKEIAERALRDYRTALEKAGLSLALAGMEKNITVKADKEKMAESVTNAISNAIKHTKSGGLTVTLRADDQFGYIDVTDTGEGMPPEVVANLFSRTGIKGTNTDSAASTGLGLYIARHFMQLQDGDINVTSEPDKGSIFTYKIPLASAPKPLS